jgi:hypothetical protein
MDTKTKTVRNTPADPTLSKVPITLDGKKYLLVWDFNSLATGEFITGQNLLQSLTFRGLSALQLRGMFFAGLLKLQPKITLEEAGSLLKDDPTCGRVVAALVEAYHGSMPEPTPEEKDPNVQIPEAINS